MIIIGAGGLAKELLDILIYEQEINSKEIFLFDNVNSYSQSTVFDEFVLLKSFEELEIKLKQTGDRFLLGLGNPQHRQRFYKLISNAGGDFKSIISGKASVGSFRTTLGEGCIILPGAVISTDVQIGKGVLINLNSTISHDCEIGDFVEIACGVNIAGHCKIGNKAFIGTGAILNPHISVGKESIIGAGSVVIHDVPDKVTVVGNPARVIKEHE